MFCQNRNCDPRIPSEYPAESSGKHSGLGKSSWPRQVSRYCPPSETSSLSRVNATSIDAVLLKTFSCAPEVLPTTATTRTSVKLAGGEREEVAAPPDIFHAAGGDVMLSNATEPTTATLSELALFLPWKIFVFRPAEQS